LEVKKFQYTEKVAHRTKRVKRKEIPRAGKTRKPPDEWPTLEGEEEAVISLGQKTGVPHLWDKEKSYARERR